MTAPKLPQPNLAQPKLTAPKFRFAPSPTGFLHIGNARTALFNWLTVLKSGGRYLLRLDDTDRERSRPEYERAIIEDLAWLGVVPHDIARQSDRLDRYAAAAEELKRKGLLYPGYETPEELERRRKRQLQRGAPPVYDRAALRLTAQDRSRLEAEGRRPHWRFKLTGQVVSWEDGVRGPSRIDTASLSDPILIREDGQPLYTFTSVVDDAELGITNVIRGEDHVTNTAVQLEIFAGLGAAPPAFAHHNLLTTASGEGLSKRLGHLSLRGLREAGIEPMAVAALAVLTGTSEALQPTATMEELAELFSLGKVSRASAKFDEQELSALNGRLLHKMPYSAVADRLSADGIEGGEAFWLAVRGNCAKLADAARWWGIVASPIEPQIDEADREFLAEAAATLPQKELDEASWRDWTTALKERTGRKGRDLFMPLRRALTGIDHGPDMAHLLPLIGRSRALKRLGGEAA
ncbi:MAG: glutamate--tRNA ligase [Hyphomicrobiales bacterium]|nr:glutamate--tRNA ligase [Hyphomicrobiales bacterium]